MIAGHARLLAAKQLGMVEVPTISLHHLGDAQIAAYKIADNRLGELSTWDDKLLAESLRDLSLLNLDFSLERTGFDMGEIDLRIEGLEIVPEKGRADPADAVAEVVVGAAVMAVGDLWLLGRHRVSCGSALEADSFATRVMTRDTAVGSYAVGRGKPPAHSRFKPGQSGNAGADPGAPSISARL